MKLKKDHQPEEALYRMTDADLKAVLKTVNQKVAESVARAEQAHLQRLSAIQARHGG